MTPDIRVLPFNEAANLWLESRKPYLSPKTFPALGGQ